MNDINKKDDKTASIILIGIIVTIILFVIISAYIDINNRKKMEKFCNEEGGDIGIVNKRTNNYDICSRMENRTMIHYNIKKTKLGWELIER